MRDFIVDLAAIPQIVFDFLLVILLDFLTFVALLLLFVFLSLIAKCV